jgi:hypothetical protein
MSRPAAQSDVSPGGESSSRSPDETGYVWTFLDEARDPEQIKLGALIVVGDEDTAAVCEVVDLAPAGDGTIVHLRLLPGLVEDYQALVERALAS